MKRISWINWRTYFLSMPINIVVLMFSADHKVETLKGTIVWGAVGLISHLILAPFIAFIIYVYRYGMSWKFDLLNLIVLGAIRGIVIIIFANKFNLVLTVTPLYKTLNSMLALPQWFVAISVLIESRRRFQKEFRALFVKAMEIQKQRKDKNRILPSNMTAAEETIAKLQILTNSLHEDLQNVISRSRDLTDYSKQSEKIDKIIESDLKPKSRKLWTSQSIIVPRIPLIKLLQISAFQNRLRVPEVVLISIPYYFIGIYADANTKTTFFQCSLLVLNDLSIYFIFEILHKYFKFSRKRTNMMILILIPILGIFTQKFLVPNQFKIIDGAFEFWTFELFMTVTFFLLVLTLNSYAIVTKNRYEIINSLQKLLDTKNVDALIDANLISLEEKNLAEYIHGEVQAGLIASSLLLQKAADAKDQDLAQEAIERAAGLLDQDHTSLYYTRMAKPEARLQKIIDGWKGIAEIHINVPEISKIFPEVLRNAVSLIEESINNSIRHAESTVINVSGILKGENLTISIVTDGKNPLKGKAGLGTKLYDDLTEEWYFTIEGNLTKLVLVFVNN